MSVTVRLFAVFRERVGQSTLSFEAAPGETVDTVWERVVAAHPDLDALRKVTRFAVNGEYATPETPVRDGDEVAFLPPMSGGSLDNTSGLPMPHRGTGHGWRGCRADS